MIDLLRAALVAEALGKLIAGLEVLEALEARLAVLEQRFGIAPPPAAASTRMH
jgi:hypothetical protein